MSLLNNGCVRRIGIGSAALPALALGLISCSRSKSPDAATPAPAASSSSAATTTAPAAKSPAPATAAVPESVRKLLGRWLRSDGGYVLELRGAEVSGVIDAGYFNPKSIRVSRAIWMQGGAGLQVMVELNDVGYPGATYALTYDPQNDRFLGQYTQPQMQQTFDIEFVRQSKP